MDKLDKELQERKIPRSKVSEEAARGPTTFNKTFSEAEDLRMSTFLRYWFSIMKIIEREEKEPIKFDSMLDDEMREVVEIAVQIADDELEYVVNNNKEFFMGIKIYVKELKKSKALTQEEMEIFSEILDYIKEA